MVRGLAASPLSYPGFRGTGDSGFGRSEDFVDMAADFDFAPDVENFAVFADQKGRAIDSHIFFAIHAFFDPDPIFFRNIAFFVRGEREVQGKFFTEFLVAGHAVA